MSTVRFSVRLPENVYHYVSERAEKSGLSLSEALIQILEDYIRTEPVLERLEKKIDMLVAEVKK